MHIYVYICKCIFTYTPNIYTHAWAIRKKMYRTTCYFIIPSSLKAPFRSLSFRFFRCARHCRDQRSSKDQERPRLIRWKKTCSCCVLPCKGQQNSSKTLSSLCLCSSTSLAFSLLTSHYFLLLFFPGAVPVTIFFTIFLLFISRYTSSHYFFYSFFTN